MNTPPPSRQGARGLRVGAALAALAVAALAWRASERSSERATAPSAAPSAAPSHSSRARPGAPAAPLAEEPAAPPSTPRAQEQAPPSPESPRGTQEGSPRVEERKPPRAPLNARLETLSPPPWAPPAGEGEGAARRPVSLGAQEVGLRAGGARLKVQVSLSAATAEGERVLWALRGRAREALHFLVSHRAPEALSLPDAEERLRADLSARLHNIIRGYEFEVDLEGFEVLEDESAPE